MEKFQIELVVELIDQDLQWSESNLKRHQKNAAKTQHYPLEYTAKMKELEGRIKDLKVIRNLMIYGE